ncbi:family 20 glycosylhydrolase [bacterium]|nr:family 20 glycosylhydrolase [bacterium]
MNRFVFPLFLFFMSSLFAEGLRCGLTTQGLYVSFRDKTLVRRSSIVVLSGGNIIYDSTKRKITARQEGNAFVWQDETPDLFISYKASYVEEGVEVVLTVKLLRNIQATLQYFLAQMPVSQFAGASFRTEDKANIVPLISKAQKMEDATLAESFRSLALHTQEGEFNISLEGEGKSLLIDARLPVWSKDELWLGYLDVPLTFDKELHFRTLFNFIIKALRERKLSAIVSGVYKENLFQRNWTLPVLPPPKFAEWGSEVFHLHNPKVFLDNSPTPIDARIVRSLVEILREKGYSSEVQSTQEFVKNLNGNIVLTKNEKILGEILGQEGTNLLKEPLSPEGYILIARPSFILIYGKDESGLFYGVQTLRWILSRKGVITCKIKDYPAFTIRGIHFFADKSSLQFYIQLIKKVLAPLKVNTIILECEYAEWKSQPKLTNDWTMTQEEIAKLISVAKENFISVYPLVQSFGHAEWAFQKKDNLDIAEDPRSPYAFCPSNPRTYDFLFRIYDEAIRLFQNPAIFHIGADEVEMIGRFPNPSCPNGCGNKDCVTLYVQHIKKIYDYLTNKNCKVMIWGDELLAPGEAGDATHAGNKQEAEGRRKLLPKDIIIADWHYNVFSDYPSVGLFKQAGFNNIVACTWNKAQNIYMFARSAFRQGAIGLIETTWAGFYNTDSLTKNFDQVAPYVLCATYGWNPDAPAPNSLPHMAELFKELWEGDMEKEKDGWALDLNVLGVASFEEIQSGERFIGGKQFIVPQKKVVLQAKNAFAFEAPNVVNIRLNNPLSAGMIFFLHCAVGEEPPGTPIGEYEIQYEDGGKEVITLQLGKNIMPLGSEKLTIFLSAPLSNRIPGLRIFSWKNPFPKRKITGINITSYVTRSAILLFGISIASH